MKKKYDMLPFDVYVRHVYYHNDDYLDEYNFTTSSLADILALWYNPQSKYQQISLTIGKEQVDFTSYSRYTTELILGNIAMFKISVDKLAKKLSL